MKAINIEKEYPRLSKIFNLARTEPVLLFANGEEFILSRADDFESEVETLRNSIEFQSFLNERTQCKERFSIDEIEKELAKYDTIA